MIKLTAIGSGYYRVYVNDIEVSRHTSEREAIESAFEKIKANPNVLVHYKHDYDVTVKDDAVIISPTIPPVVIGRRLFLPESFYNVKLTDAVPIHLNSIGMVKELVRQSKPQNTNSSQPLFDSLNPIYDVPTYDPAIPYLPNVTTLNYSAADITVKDVNVLKIAVKILKPDGTEGSWMVDLNKELASGFRIPAGSIPASGTDSHLSIWDQVDDRILEIWHAKQQADGSWRGEWGGVINDVSNSDGIVFTTCKFQNGLRITTTLGKKILFSSYFSNEELIRQVI